MTCKDCFYFDSCKKVGKEAVIYANGEPIGTINEKSLLGDGYAEKCTDFIQQFRFNL